MQASDTKSDFIGETHQIRLVRQADLLSLRWKQTAQ